MVTQSHDIIGRITPDAEAPPPRRARRWRVGLSPSLGDQRALKLVGREASRLQPRPNVIEPIRQATDPRWVLAIRVAQALDGPILRPERRERLLRVGKVLGLSPFDTNLVIAIIQDRARRGIAPLQCARACTSQLEMVPLPVRGGDREARAARAWRITTIVACLITAELLLLVTVLG